MRISSLILSPMPFAIDLNCESSSLDREDVEGSCLAFGSGKVLACILCEEEFSTIIRIK